MGTTNTKSKPAIKSTSIRVSVAARDKFTDLAHQNRVAGTELFDVLVRLFSELPEAQQSAAIRRR